MLNEDSRKILPNFDTKLLKNSNFDEKNDDFLTKKAGKLPKQFFDFDVK